MLIMKMLLTDYRPTVHDVIHIDNAEFYSRNAYKALCTD